MTARRCLLSAVTLAAAAMLVVLLVPPHAAHSAPLEEPRAIPRAFYLWQYDWTPAVAEAVAESAKLAPDSLYVVAGEIGGEGAPQPDWAVLKAALPPNVRIIPVIRVHGAAAKQIETAPDALADTISAHICGLRTTATTAGIEITEIQLDLDCPERLLTDYANFLRKLKPRLGGLRLTVTAIPCHLTNSAFADVARATTGYTLQVHGVQFPKTLADITGNQPNPAPAQANSKIKNRQAKIQLMDAATARRAIAAAERLGVPYRLALPTYAYRFVFGADGKCRGILQPFSPPPDLRRSTIRTISTDPVAVREIYQLACRTRTCAGITWFRLPVKGDDACWELAAIAAIRAGRPVECGLRAEWHTLPDGSCELRLTNHAVLDARTASVTLRWPSRQGDYGLLAAKADADSLPGVLPEKLTVRIPPPGETVTLAWFRTPAAPDAITVTPETAR